MKSKHLGDPSSYSEIDPQTPISKYFTWHDFTQTATGIENLPDDEQYANILSTAALADQMYDELGPFKILSAFRTQDVQDQLGESGMPVGTSGAGGSTRSFHVAGMAFDFAPTTMSPQDYFGKILASDWKNKLGEIFLKPSQNTIHVGQATAKYQGYAKVLNDAGTYVKLTAQEIEDYAKPFLQSISDFASNVESTASEAVASPIGKGALLAGLGALALFLFSKRKANSRS